MSPQVRARILDLMRRMPKAELHVHLEGTLSAERLRAIAARDSLDLDESVLGPVGEDEQGRSFDTFLRAFLARYFALRTPDDYAAATDDLLRAQAEQNTPYTEAFVTFEGALRGRYVLADVLRAIAEVESGWRRRGVALRLVVDAPRTLGEEVCTELFRLAAADPTGLCIGVGLGGVEEGFPPQGFARAFALARDAGLRRTAHAGEHGAAANVAAAVEVLGAERIGHGVAAASDPHVLRLLAARGITVDCCPQSNLRTGSWRPQDGPHPIRAFLDAGIRVDVGSDDPACFGTSLTEEWTSLVVDHGFSVHECVELTAAAADSCFLDEQDRARLSARFEADLVDLRDEAAALEEAMTA